MLLEIIDKRGAFYSYGETRLGQGRENSKEFLRQNTDLLSEIEDVIRQQAAGMLLDLPTSDDEEDGDISDEDV